MAIIMLSVMAHLFVALGIPGVHRRSLFMMLFLLIMMILRVMMFFVMRCLVIGRLVMGSLGVRVCDTSLTIKWQMHMMLLSFVFDSMRGLCLDIMVELGVLVLDIMHKLLLVVEILTVDIATVVHTLRNLMSEIPISLVPVIVMITAIV